MHYFLEKLTPLITLNALQEKPLSVYGDGKQIRDWLYVEDHAHALIKVALEGKLGETYNVGGFNEKQNIKVIRTICSILDEVRPRTSGAYADLIEFVKDRPGHDRRYAIDFSKIKNELGWQPSYSFEEGMEQTVEWYLNHQEWCANVTSGKYQRERLGI